MDFNIKDVLNRTLRSMRLDRRVKEYAAWKVWDQVVGETVAQQAQPASVRRGILFVTCSSSVWMQQLQLMKVMILEKLNAHLGQGVIKDIRFQIGMVARLDERGSSPTGKDVSLEEDEMAWVNDVASPLRDPELRDVVKRVLAKDASLRKGA